MATFNNKTFKKNDEYYTPKSAWEDIKHIIPKDKIIWEGFFGDSKSGTFLSELGFKTIHKKVDFFKHNLGQVVVTNPAFSLIPQTLKRLVELQKPFILLMPSSKINTQYFRKTFLNQKDKIKIIIPKKRIHFIKQDGSKSSCNFDCFYYCWKIEGLKNEITWLD